MTSPRGGGPAGAVVGRVVELWRYPVKSLGGERLPGAQCERRGLSGDRTWAVIGEDGKIGSGKTTRRFRRMPGLLSLTGHTETDGSVWVEFPDGRRGDVDDPATAMQVSEVTGERVHFGRESRTSHFDDGALHLVTAVALARLRQSAPDDVSIDSRRFRPNLVLETDETIGTGSRYLLGDQAVLAVTAPTVRCVMTTMAQPGLGFAPSVLAQLVMHHEGCFGVYAEVERPGEVSVGDPVVLLR